jgi:hypothetical protein
MLCVARQRQGRRPASTTALWKVPCGARPRPVPRITNPKRQEEGKRPRLSNSRPECLEKPPTNIEPVDATLFFPRLVTGPHFFRGVQTRYGNFSRPWGDPDWSWIAVPALGEPTKKPGSTIGKNFPKQPRRRLTGPASLETASNR